MICFVCRNRLRAEECCRACRRQYNMIDGGRKHRSCCTEHARRRSSAVRTLEATVPAEEIISKSSWEHLQPNKIQERACRVCKTPEPYLPYVRCSSDDNQKKNKVVRTKLLKDGTSFEEFDKQQNAKSEHGHIVIDVPGSMIPKPVLSKVGQFKRNPLKRLIGYEIETSTCVDGAKVTRLAREYGCGLGSDGGAFEMNTPPANGDKLCEMITDISTKIRKYGAKCMGAGSGLHTHVDIRDARYPDLRKIIMLYGKTESALYSIIDSRRATNSTCKPLGGAGLVLLMSDYDNHKENINRLVYAQSPKGKGAGLAGRRNKDPRGGSRYVGLNLHSWWMRGTIEFRMHHGTTKHEKMIPWGMLLGSMCDIGIGRGDREIDSWPMGLEGLLKIAPTEEVKRWVQERWDYFASKRANKKEPWLPMDNMVDLPNDEIELDY